MAQILAELGKIYNMIPVGFWHALIASGVLSPTLQAIKHWCEVQKGWVMFALLSFFALAGSMVEYLHSANPGNPMIILLHTAVVGFVSQLVYFPAVKPSYNKIVKLVNEADQQVADVRSAILPAGGLQVSTVAPAPPTDMAPPTGNDFSV